MLREHIHLLQYDSDPLNTIFFNFISRNEVHMGRRIYIEGIEGGESSLLVSASWHYVYRPSCISSKNLFGYISALRKIYVSYTKPSRPKIMHTTSQAPIFTNEPTEFTTYELWSKEKDIKPLHFFYRPISGYLCIHDPQRGEMLSNEKMELSIKFINSQRVYGPLSTRAHSCCSFSRRPLPCIRSATCFCRHVLSLSRPLALSFGCSTASSVDVASRVTYAQVRN